MEISIQKIESKIFEIREHKVMLDFDIAFLYEVETKVLNQAVRRNIKRFPESFMFQITKEEWSSMRSQFVTASSQHKRNTSSLPYAFTEHGVTMLASVLRSDKAIQLNIAIVEAFITLRKYSMNYKLISDKILELEKNYNKQFKDIYEALKYLLEKDEEQEDLKDRKMIGY